MLFPSSLYPTFCIPPLSPSSLSSFPLNPSFSSTHSLPSFHSSPPGLKVLCTLLAVPSICDFGKSIWQAVWWGVATSDMPNATIVEHHVVAPVQIVTPIVFVMDMVRCSDVLAASVLDRKWETGVQYIPLPAFPSPQVLAILLILRERHLGVKSSGIQFVFWMVLLVYEVIRLRSMSLIHQDDLVLVGRGGAGQHKTMG